MKKILFLALFLLPSIALALTFGEPVYNGNGCPPGSNSFVLSPDNTSLSILTGQFALDVTHGTAWRHCELVIPVSVTRPGFVKADFRGFHSLPDNALHETLVTHRPLGGPGQVNAQNYFRVGSEIDNFFHAHLFNISFASQTAIRLIVSTLLSNPSTSESMSLSMDSIDLTVEKPTFFPSTSCNSAIGFRLSAVIAAIMSISALL
jgi:hypothetical protein